ncbi:MAG: hypothetical protein KAG96_05555 [Ichthyobacteriaceae bacterium]|nr:hypothetical protein [Ichthyobacteriaceae bacterium]
MKKYKFTEEDKIVLTPLIEARYISVYGTYDRPNQKDIETISDLKGEFAEYDECLFGKEERSMLCSIIDENLINPHSELMQDYKEMTEEEYESIADEYKEIIENVKYYKALKNKISPYKKNKD